ncbi:MAG: 3-methyl-2-oxobutanoate hydroxymethyltransferase [Candidatus Saccharibacteria bacterium]|nr:3-methyl-2-oxobutanoate hydroxymethyltransferase [Pseudorhodobacter sp.]
MARKLPTVADLLALKGTGQRTMLKVFTLDEAAAAGPAGIDIVSIGPDLMMNPAYRPPAPTLFSMTGKTHLEAGTPDDYLRWAGAAMQAGADAIYCSGSMRTIEHLAREHIPVVGHVGLVPSRASWIGGFRAVGKTADQALALLNEVRACEAAGAFAVEIEVVPPEVATAISQRVGTLLWSMGAGTGCDAQYLFANDLLGYTSGHVPRHSKAYRDFAAEHFRLQRERVAAFNEFRTDVETGAYPQPQHLVRMDDTELLRFLTKIDDASNARTAP